MIKEFDRKYKQMQVLFVSIAAGLCMLHQVYFSYALQARFAGLSPAQVLGYPVENLDCRLCQVCFREGESECRSVTRMLRIGSER